MLFSAVTFKCLVIALISHVPVTRQHFVLEYDRRYRPAVADLD